MVFATEALTIYVLELLIILFSDWRNSWTSEMLTNFPSRCQSSHFLKSGFGVRRGVRMRVKHEPRQSTCATIHWLRSPNSPPQCESYPNGVITIMKLTPSNIALLKRRKTCPRSTSLPARFQSKVLFDSFVLHWIRKACDRLIVRG